jgi:hypothetical protein
VGDYGSARHPSRASLALDGPNLKEGAVHARTLQCLLSLAAVIGPLALVPVASGSTVTVRNDAGSPGAFYTAAPGELNDVLVVYADRHITITDPGAVITVSGRCRSIDPHGAVCRGQFMTAHIASGDLDDRVATPRRIAIDASMVVDAGAGDDVLRGGRNEDVVFRGAAGDDRLYGGGGSSKLNGGAGNDFLHGEGDFDELNGGSGNDELHGEAGGDELNGGGGQDRLFGGDHNDTLTDGDRDDAAGDAGPGPDLLVGGDDRETRWDDPEGDTLSYEQRKNAVSAHAGSDMSAGEPGEGDSIIGIESFAGGAGNDRLVGDRHVNYLDGGGGADTLIGGRGRDDLKGGRGKDRLRGGRDDDDLTGEAGYDTLSCGSGDDLVRAWGLRARDVMPGSCERLSLAWGNADRSLRLRAHPTRTRPWWLKLRVMCPYVWVEDFDGCRGEIAVRESRGDRRLLAVGHFWHGVDDAAFFPVELALTNLGYRWWAEGVRRASATVTLRMIAEATPRTPFMWTINNRRRE